MNGLDNVLNKLSEGLAINNKALQSLYEALGGNFGEVYSKLATEYSIYIVAQSFLITSIIISVVSLIIMGVVLVNSSVYEINMNPTEKKVVKILSSVLCVCIGIIFLALLSPLLYPNLSLILSILDRLGGK